MLADVWQWTPFMVLIFLAGLRALPKEPFEAAAIDGASALQQFRHLTLPMLGKVIAIAVLIRSIDLFRIYDYVYVMTGGGPGHHDRDAELLCRPGVRRRQLPLRRDAQPDHADRPQRRDRRCSSGSARIRF